MSGFDTPPTERPQQAFQDVHARLSALERPTGRLTQRLDAQVSTTSPTPVALGGPSLTVSSTEGQLYTIAVRVDGLNAGGSSLTYVYIDGAAFGSPLAGGASYTTDRDIYLWDPDPGEHTVELRYTTNGAGTAFFKNRRLWARSF